MKQNREVREESANPLRGTWGQPRLFRASQILFFVCFVFQDRFSLCNSLAILELALVDHQTGLELREIHLPWPPKCWD